MFLRHTIKLSSNKADIQRSKKMENELLTTDELSARIKYDVRTIRERLKDSVLLEGVHYFRP